MTSISADPRCSAHPSGRPEPCALLWDESLLWGIMARRALQEAGLPFALLRAEEVRRGALDHYRMLFVPGGWAANKRAALGEAGCGVIRRFVETGGSYLGICGGAGLATGEGIALLPVVRKPSSRRVASFSGGIAVYPAAHPLWQGIGEPVFTAWWPSQLAVAAPGVRVLAAYGRAQPDAFSSDIPVENGKRDWPALEERYGILLDPERLRGEPAVLEGRLGDGRVVLSLLHFDTPGDRNGRLVLQNLWQYLAGHAPVASGNQRRPEAPRILPPGKSPTAIPADILAMLEEIRIAGEELIAVGEGLSLWRWRTPYLLQWRRGVRGLEYSTLAVMTRDIQGRLTPGPEPPGTGAPVSCAVDPDRLRGELQAIRRQLGPFVSRAKDLLAREHRCLQAGPLSPLRGGDGAIQKLRKELFGSAMSHGGTFKGLIDTLDRLWFDLIGGGNA